MTLQTRTKSHIGWEGERGGGCYQGCKYCFTDFLKSPVNTAGISGALIHTCCFIFSYKVRGKPVMGQMKPASYVKLSDLLAEELKNTLETYPVITHSNLLRIVQNASLDLDEMELQQAVRFLHESGVLLHYDDSTLHLRELYFIDPGWLCRMMAQVVTVPQINPFIKNGILRKNDVRLLFTGKKLEENFIFPKSLIPQYLKLLEKFEIALPYSEEELLIPSRLPEKVPEFNVPKLKKDEKICRFYRMPHVPLGLWSRLITRMIVFSKSVVTETLMELPTSSVPEMHYWKTGIFVCWSQTSFFLLSSCISDKDDKEEIQITVPATKNGCLLLGQVVDHLDALIDEWYPGLTSVDPLQGRHLLEKYAPCVYCEDSDQSPYQFLLEDLLKQTESRLDAPDLVLSDLDSGLQLDVSQFDLVESPENLLGDGGYGAVYKAKYKNQHVAVKMFNAIGDIHPHIMLRQEADVFSYGITIYSLLTGGKHPFFEYEFNSEMDRAISESKEILNQLMSPESLCLRQWVPVSVETTVECMAFQNDVLWVGTGSGSIALVDLNTKQPITITNRYTSAVRSLMYISCQVHGGWTSYSEWSTCNVSCGGGTQSKIRSCTNPAPQYGGNNCVGSTTESRACNTHNCPIHGGWTSYSEWSTCNVSCGGGTQSKIRSCTNPAPQYGGNNCVGSTTESRACNTYNCPIHGGWTSYSEWSTCNVSCGGGTQSKIRSCTNPAPQYGGNNCVGPTTESRACNTHNCPIDGGWSEWNIGEWDSCPNTCGDEIQNREDVRYCNTLVHNTAAKIVKEQTLEKLHKPVWSKNVQVCK
ncbi:hypothetical protein KUTeg_021230 [Tegillarca granosa]|uniref:Uncharacterized protein n=1 Tax=Tegillarca granosa TaxID=220873 RepID=A0ABQ9EA82_TEGGR|nr:hypothetical protein KUTeg_021230 [Tegillarca granosa]